MQLSLVLSALASIVVLAAAYPMEGAIARRSDAQKRGELDTDGALSDNYYDYHSGDEEKRGELDTDGALSDNYYDYHSGDEEKREELYAGETNYYYRSD
ncbi:hypothetical protein EV424DRAFT_570301 [Suillus variegatus]|nr:hypothetical protein EV424DRAFT_570301 [Suillus variegatus]